MFKGQKETARDEEFETDEFEEEEESSVFDSERKKQRELSEFVADTGRSSKSKKKVRRGDDFLLSDKAKEIYANTER